MKITKKMAREILDQALLREAAERLNVLLRYSSQGHLHVARENDAANITVVVEGERFTEKRSPLYPSTELLARVALAIAAGRSNNNMVIDADVTAEVTSDMFRDVRAHLRAQTDWIWK